MNTEQNEAEVAKFEVAYDADDFRRDYDRYGPRAAARNVWLASATASEGRIAELTAALQAALAVIKDYLEYEHNGDPWTEDARTMGEMDINDYKRDGRLEAAEAALAGSATPSATKPKTLLTLNGYQLLEALDAAWPDRDTDHEQGDTEISFWMRDTAEVIDGELCEAGLYAYWSEYPEEGSFPLPPEPRAPAPVPQDTLKNADSGAAGLPPELSKAFITLESNGGDGRTIVLKFNHREDAYAVHDFLLRGGAA